jgi:zinc and cadmium transporter
MNFLVSVLALSLPVIITGVFALYFKLNQIIFKLVLAFSAAYLFSTTIMHLLPEVYVSNDFKYVGLFIVVGFSAQLLIENLSTGLEHGHSHHHSDTCKQHFPYGIIIGLLIHSFLEGLPVYHSEIINGQSVGLKTNHQLIFGLIIHNIPISFLFVALLKDHGVKWLTIIFFLILFSLMAPFGFLFSYLVHTFHFLQLMTYQYVADAIVIGIFLYISTAILFETSEEHKYSPSKILSMFLGILLAFILS